jgi:hypothetical protein
MTPERATEFDAASARERVEAHPSWRQTIDVAPGVTTPGRLDLRPVVDLLPWPNVRGKRCLDIRAANGFFALELERRGAAEVVALESDPADGEGLRLVADMLGSNVELRSLGLEELDPADLGLVDVVVASDVVARSRDPVGALGAVRDVCRGLFLSAESIDSWLSILGRGRPLLRLQRGRPEGRWWLPNGFAHRELLFQSGFRVEQVSRPYVVPFGRGARATHGRRTILPTLGARFLTGTSVPGELHRALLSRPV